MHERNIISFSFKNSNMKKIFIVSTVVTLFVACKGNKTNLDADKQMVTLSDSSMYNSSYLSDTGRMAQPVPPVVTAPARYTNSSPAPRRYANSGTSTRRSTGVSSKARSTSSGTANSGTTTSTRKKGWSKAAKGATIGGVGGAVAGAVITKSGKGAVVGGVIGAAGGYILGRSKDKKDGRVQ